MSSSGEIFLNLNHTKKAKTKTQLLPVMLGMDHEIN